MRESVTVPWLDFELFERWCLIEFIVEAKEK